MVGPVKLAYEVLGSYSRRKSPLLIIHGILGSRSNWKTVGRKLSVELETEVGPSCPSLRVPSTEENLYFFLLYIGLYFRC